MAFDAGSIVAHLDLDDAEFDRKLRADVAKIEAFEKAQRKSAITTDLDPSAIARTRRQFATMDTQLTRDAQQRMSGGQGSVLGTLMGFTSRRALPGAPAPSQSAIGRDVAALTGGGGGAGGGGGFLRGIAGGAGPGILGISPKIASIAGLGGLALGALPALAAPTAALGVGALGLGVAAGLGKAAAGPALQLASAQSQAQQALAAAVTPAQVKAAQAQLASVNQQAAQLSPALRSIFGSITSIQSWWHKFTGSLAPMIAGPLRQIVPLIESLGTPLRQVFGGAMTLVMPFVRGLTDVARTVLPLLNSAFRAAAPAIRPLLDGLGRLLAGLLPGVITILKAAHPAIVVFSQVLGSLGKDLGAFFADMAPALNASGIVLKALFDVIGGLLPVIAKLAGEFATYLAPVIGAFATAIKALMPVLIIIGKVIAEFAAAVLGDLAAALIAVAKLLVGIAPSLGILAAALGKVFTILENSGVFGVLAAALEQLVGPLTKLINALVIGLAPALPALIGLFAQLVTLLAAGLAAGLGAVATALADIVTAIPPPLLQAIAIGVLAIWAGFKGYSILKGVTEAVRAFGAGTEEEAAGAAAAWVRSTAIAIASWVRQAAASAASAIKMAAQWVVSTAVIVASFVAQAAAATAAFIVENIATLGIIAGIALLVAAIIYLATHWKQVWTDVKNWAHDAWEFLTHGWGQFLIPGLTLIRLTVELVSKHWHQAWTDMTNWAVDAWHGIYGNVCAPMIRVFTQDLPGAFKAAVGFIGRFWTGLQNTVRGPVSWVIDHVLNGLIDAFDWITSHVGLGKPISEFHPMGLAHGGRLGGYGGGDILPALLEPGETVVSKEDSRHPAMLAAFAAAGVPGYLFGGPVPGGGGPAGNIGATTRPAPAGGSSLLSKAGDIVKIMAALATGNPAALSNAISDMIFGHGTGGATAELGAILTSIPRMLLSDVAKYLIGQGGGLGGSGNSIIKYAESFIGKVPYVWGGESPAGWDCSGFVEYVYRHFGINPPRTSEAQFGWARHTGAPVPGGLAFFAGADGSQASPGHVGIVVNANRMVDAYATGFGTRFDSIIGSSGAISGYGVPPGGVPLPGGAGGAGVPPGGVAAWLQAAIGIAGVPRSWLGALEKIQSLETDNLANMTTVVNPNGGATGLMQVKPGTFAGVFPGGNITNPVDNAVAGIRHILQSWGSPDMIPGIGLPGFYNGYDQGGWLMPGATVALNNTGMPEAVLSPAQSQQLLHGGSGRLAGVINIMLPEGTTVAQALTELTFLMRVSDQQALAGAGMRP